MSKALDKLDMELLNLLQQNNVATAETLAQSVALSPSAITRRVRRLREEGFIDRDVAILAPSLSEHRLRALIHIQLKEHAPENGLASFRERLRRASEVQYCAEITGPFDLLAIIVTRDMAAFNAFADEMLEAEPAVRRYETSFVRREIKNAPVIRLEESDIRR